MEVPKPEKYDKKADQKNVLLAADLDRNTCQWCLFAGEGISRQGSSPHHIFGRRRRWDVDAIVTLCVSCHSNVHMAKQKYGKTIISKKKLEKLMIEKVIPARKLRAKHFDIDVPDAI